MLNTLQQKAVETVVEGHNVFITGGAGTGKSYTLKHIIRALKGLGRRYAITSSTGCSAVLIGGQTVHSYLGMGAGGRTVEQIVDNIKGKKLSDLQKLQILIIDEISMVDDHTLVKMSGILQKIKRVFDRAFGGIQVIFIGDFCQLPPVSGNYCFLSDVWNQLQLRHIVLTELVRQKDDIIFQQILHEIRLGKCSQKTWQTLAQLEENRFEDGIRPTRLYSLNSDVALINQHEFRQVFKKNALTEADIFRYPAISNDKNVRLDDYHIELIKGLQVIVIRNIDFESGLVNGTTGVICELDKSNVCIIDNYKKKHVIQYHTDVNENNNAYVKFMPLKMAYALSIHKSQGATLDAIEVDGSTFIFAPGQLYTALSRARNLNSIRLLNLDRGSVICNKNVKEFYQNLVENQE